MELDTISKVALQAFKKESFYIPKRVLLHTKRSPFALQNEYIWKAKGLLYFLVDKTLHNVAVFIDTTIAQERPPATHILAMSKVYIYYYALLLIGC